MKILTLAEVREAVEDQEVTDLRSYSVWTTVEILRRLGIQVDESETVTRTSPPTPPG